MKIRILTLLCCLLPYSMASLHGASQWTMKQGGNWNISNNWSPRAIPNGSNAEAILRLPSNANPIIDSDSDITIRRLVLDTPGSLNIHFTNHKLIFQSDSNSSAIFVAQGNPIINTPIVINDKFLKVTGNRSSKVSFRGDISGAGGLLLEKGLFSCSGNNTYSKETVLVNAEAHVNGRGVVIPGTISVSDSSRLFHATSNNYSPDSSLFIVNNGYVDFGDTTQTLFNLLIFKGTAVGPNATVCLLSSGNAITVKAESSISIKNLILPNGGYMQFSSIKGVFDGSPCEEGFMAMDLGDETLNLDVHHHESFPPFGMGFNNVMITRGSIVKLGIGGLFFSGKQANIPSMSIQAGGVYIGTAADHLISTSGDLEVGANGRLSGFGTLGTNGDAAVYNAGAVKPGSDSSLGALRISGSYSQNSSGRLVIKVQNVNAADKLIVDQKGISLDGALVLQVQKADALKPGDQIVVIDNINTDATILGSFSSFDSNLPPHLHAVVQYGKNQVSVLIQ